MLAYNYKANEIIDMTPSINSIPYNNTSHTTSSSEGLPINEEVLEQLLEEIRVYFAQEGISLPTDENLTREIVDNNKSTSRSALSQALLLENLVKIYRQKLMEYVRNVKTNKREQLEGSVQTVQLFFKDHGTELAAVIANTISKSPFINADESEKIKILIASLIQWAKEKNSQEGIENSFLNNINPILTKIKSLGVDGGIEYFKNIVKASIEDAQGPLSLTPAFVEYLKKIINEVVTIEKSAHSLESIINLLTQYLPEYLHNFVPENLSPQLRKMVKEQISNIFLPLQINTEERIEKAKKIGQEGVWDYFMQLLNATPRVKMILEPLKQALQSDVNKFSNLPEDIRSSVIETLTKTILEKIKPFELLEDKALKLLEDLIRKCFKITLDSDLADEKSTRIQKLQKCLEEFEIAYLREQGYSKKAQLFLRSIIAKLKSKAFWGQNSESRADQVVKISKAFLESYVNPQMTRREFLTHFVNCFIPKWRTNYCGFTFSEQVRNTIITRRAIPAFLSLNGLFKFLGKVP
jgi:hypothetical protein